MSDKAGIVRPMKPEDLEAVLQIEQISFPTPWSPQAFLTELKENEYARYFCLEADNRVIGYMGLWFILDEGHITNIAIDPAYRSKGWGRYFLKTVMSTMKSKGMERMTLEVRVTNTPAQHLYEQLGFSKAGVRKGYYADNQEDAIIMWADLYDEKPSNI